MIQHISGMGEQEGRKRTGGMAGREKQGKGENKGEMTKALP